ncbi:phosphotransferase system fructose-specific component IIB [Pediococcus acidilactici NGRI 0510Q]|nr:phosphotransferase system fructose-specific component IIB [Pediococcus acidilactici NGRI 0510Q]
MIFKITDAVPHGGPIVGVLGATNNLGLFIIAILTGTAVSVLIIAILKIRAGKKAAKQLS